MNRSLKLSMLMALALGSSQALALDLGQIQVKSALGQPLLAEIPLLPANPSELRNLTVQLASSEDFVRAGIAGGRTSIPLHFSVANGAGGQQVIRITSSVAVDDPYLDLLLEVNGGAGKSVREFTILLDPPGTSSSAVAASAQKRVARRTTPVPPKEPRAAAAPASQPRHAAAAGNGQYGPVQSGQTLSAIARNTAPAGTDMNQMLVALKQANPDAFYRDNINALKSGVVLRVPTATEAQAMEVAAAVAEVRRQNSDWRAGATGKPGVVADAGTRASASSSPTGKFDHAGDRLALVPAKEGNSNGTQGTAGAKGDKSSATARQELLRTQESLASLQQQSTDLKTRLKDLADINSKNERLLSLKDNEIAELQNKLAAARKGAGLPTTPPATTSPVSETRPAPSASVPANAAVPAHAATVATAAVGKAASAASSPVSTPVAASTAATTMAMTKPAVTASTPATTTPVKPARKPFVRPAPPLVAEDPWYMQSWAWAAGGGVVVLLLLAALLGRRRKPASAAGSAASLADRFGSDPSTGHDFADGDDVDQEELLDQLAEHPDDIGLHLELVTLYYSRRDVDHFEAAAEAMHAHITDPQQDEWQDVIHMGEDLVPGHPLFDHHPELPASEETEARRAFDIDDYANHDDALPAAPAMPPLPAAPKKVSEYSFNFDLTSAIHGAADDKAEPEDDEALPHHETPAATDEPSPSWQFDDHALPSTEHALNEFSDDPVDTKLDLARAYLDMGDAEGARAMLDEVLKEGSQMQQDVARRLLESLN
jgi:pilus assembly protein FimV